VSSPRTGSGAAITPLACPLPHDLRLWRIDLDAAAAAPTVGSLPEPLRTRASRMTRTRDGLRLLAVHDVLRAILSRELGRAPSDLVVAPDPLGKPRLADGAIRFSLSRSGRWGLVGLARDVEIGVDIEELRPVPAAEAIAREQFTARERETWAAVDAAERDRVFVRCWTRKEAVTKALGTGLRLRLEAIDAGAEDDLRAVRVALGVAHAEAIVASVALPPEWSVVAAVAIATDEMSSRARAFVGQGGGD
jgi:4'-phosphopantetheinyl transferase